MTKFLFVQCVDMPKEQIKELQEKLQEFAEKEGYTFILSDRPFRSVDKKEILRVLKDG